MAKRKRLTPPQQGYLAGNTAVSGPAAGREPLLGSGTLAAAPIAQVAGAAATTAALSELSQAMHSARSQGRLIEPLALAAINPTYLMRDRLVQDQEDMQALRASLQARGQQTPIEVVALAPGAPGGFTHGLISGWRRLSALKQLFETTGEARFGHVLARVVAQDSMQSAYVAMVEENEIRANLSHYERARIVHRAVDEGIYPTRKAALQGLFDAVSRSKRSKIGSFVGLVEALDRILVFPTAIPEKLGLELARALADSADFSTLLARHLHQRGPATTPAEELSRLAAALTEFRRAATAADGDDVARGAGKDLPLTEPVIEPASQSVPQSFPPVPPLLTGAVTVQYDAAARRIELSGDGVDGPLFVQLQAWLKSSSRS